MSTRGLFVTGTDTGIGKTRISVGLLQALRRQGRRVAGMKPVASGCAMVEGRLRNADAVALQAACSHQWPYEVINPYAFAPPIAPHIAAAAAGTTIEAAPISTAYHRLAAANEWLVVEGVGGWRVPLAADLQTRDLVRALGLPVLLVVGLRLGCINHALLTAQAIQADGLCCVGWIANRIEPYYETLEATLTTLTQAIAAPLLATVPYAPEPASDNIFALEDPCWERLAALLDTESSLS